MNGVPQQTILRDVSANPAPLGLCAFGLTTIMLNLHNAGLFELNEMVLCMGIFYGGIAQLIAGLLESKKGNTFATTAFCSYGSFWLVLVGMVLLPKMLGAAPVSHDAWAWWLGAWGLFTAVLFGATFALNLALQAVFGSLTLLFALLVAHFALPHDTVFGTIAGIEGIACGVIAVYAGLAQVLNEVYGRVIWPIGAVAKKAPAGLPGVAQAA